MTLLSSSIIFLESCLVQITPMQFLAAKSLPRMTGLDWLLHTMNFCMKECPFMLNVHWVNPMGSMLVPVAVTTVGNLSLVRLRLRDSKVLRLMQLIDAAHGCLLVFCCLLVFLFLILSCPKHALVLGNCCERLHVKIFVRVLRSSRVNVNNTNVCSCV